MDGHLGGERVESCEPPDVVSYVLQRYVPGLDDDREVRPIPRGQQRSIGRQPAVDLARRHRFALTSYSARLDVGVGITGELDPCPGTRVGHSQLSDPKRVVRRVVGEIHAAFGDVAVAADVGDGRGGVAATADTAQELLSSGIEVVDRQPVVALVATPPFIGGHDQGRAAVERARIPACTLDHGRRIGPGRPPPHLIVDRVHETTHTVTARPLDRIVEHSDLVASDHEDQPVRAVPEVVGYLRHQAG